MSFEDGQVCYLCKGSFGFEFEKAVDPETLENFSIRFCERCQLGQTFPAPKDLTPYYKDFYGNRHGFTADFRARRRLQIVEKGLGRNLKDKTLLDIGCGDGLFLQKAKQNGWKTVGTELNFDSDSGLEIYKDLGEVRNKYGSNSFKAITLWHVLEHFHDPAEVLHQASDLLNKDGRIFIAVPDAHGFQARLFKNKWFHLDPPRHLFHFGSHSLRKLLKDKNLKPIRSFHQEFEYDLLGWSQSALNKIFTTPNVFFRKLTGKSDVTGRGTVFSNFFLGTIFSFLAIPLVFFGTIFKKGGTLGFILKK